MHKMSGRRIERLAVLMRALLRSRLRGRPFFLSHLVTTRCNCSCPMCLWRDNDNAVEEMTAEQIGKFYRDGRQNGFIGTAIWGGEPLLRQDLGTILTHARACKLTTLLISNGFYLRERLGELAPNLDAVIVSLDYAEAEKHDHRRGCAGLFNRAVEAIGHIRSHHPRIKVLINCLLLRDNGDSLLPLAELARDLGISFYVCPVKEETSSGVRGVSAKEWQAGMYNERKLGEKLVGLKKAGYPLNNSYAYLNKYLGQQEAFQCHLPRIALIVRPDGKITHCMESSASLGNVTQQPLKDILSSAPYRELRRKAPQCNICNNPNIVESSYMWQFQLEPLFNAASVMLRQ
jgi:MoaA/NifB/PqqE/SkfB family radical SAM enzyme